MMNLARCNKGKHFYDADKYTICPYCNPSTTSIDATIPLDVEEKDVKEEAYDVPKARKERPGVYPQDMDEIDDIRSLEEEIHTAKQPLERDDLDRTVSFYQGAIGTDPVVGWLACIEGAHYGKSFVLHAGRCFIGRSEANDVVLGGDMSVSRERHAVIVYDPKAKCFIAAPGESRQLFYLNDNILLSNEKLKAYDVLTIGDEKLLFIPMCGEQFCWEDTKSRKAAS